MNTALAAILALSAAGPRWDKGPERHLPAVRWHTARCSFYHEGTETASGAPFRADGISFAMRSHHFGDWWEFRNPRTGRVVKARHNDWGPAAWTGREFDLSRGLARALGLLGAGEPGTLRVQVRRCKAP